MIVSFQNKSFSSEKCAPTEKIDALQLPAEKAGAIIFSISLVFYVFVCMQFLNHSVYWLLGYVADDAFYYLQTARHLAENGYSTFDGTNPTNGYHPGWMLLMVLCAKVVHSRVLLLKVCLSLEFIFHILGCFVLIKLIREIATPFWSWIAGCVWLLNPLAYLADIAGVESAFSRFAILMALWFYQAKIDPFLRTAQPLPRRNLILLGIALAFAYYGRTDQIILAAIVISALLISVYRTQSSENKKKHCLRILGFVGGAFVLCVLPWFLFSYVQVGTFSQDSGTMKELWRRQDIIDDGISSLLITPIHFLMFSWLLSTLNALVGNGLCQKLEIVIQALLLAGLCCLAAWPKRQILSGLSNIILSTVLISGLAYGLLIADSQWWHFSSPGLLIFILFSSWAGLALHKTVLPVRQWAGGIFLVLCSMVIFWHYQTTFGPLSPWQRDVYRSQQRFEHEIPPHAVIGSFNAGIPAYFGNRPIINLDGLVNNRAIPYWQNHEFNQYLAVAHIDYIADETTSLGRAQQFSDTILSLKKVDIANLTDCPAKHRYLWKVVTQGK